MSELQLAVEYVDTFRSEMAVVHLNDHIAFGRRVQIIKLTDEQLEQLKPRCLGTSKNVEQFEQIGRVWLQEVDDE